MNGRNHSLRKWKVEKETGEDRLEQQAFENWLAQQSMAHQVWQANQQARAAAARASASTPRGPSFQDILDQMKLQYMLTNMSPEERFLYATSPSLWERQIMPSWEDYLGQQKDESLPEVLGRTNGCGCSLTNFIRMVLRGWRDN